MPKLNRPFVNGIPSIANRASTSFVPFLFFFIFLSSHIPSRNVRACTSNVPPRPHLPTKSMYKGRYGTTISTIDEPTLSTSKIALLLAAKIYRSRLLRSNTQRRFGDRNSLLFSCLSFFNFSIFFFTLIYVHIYNIRTSTCYVKYF